MMDRKFLKFFACTVTIKITTILEFDFEGFPSSLKGDRFSDESS
jgi:hypothetical protein